MAKKKPSKRKIKMPERQKRRVTFGELAKLPMPKGPLDEKQEAALWLLKRIRSTRNEPPHTISLEEEKRQRNEYLAKKYS